MRQEFELTNFEASVQHFSPKATETLPVAAWYIG